MTDYYAQIHGHFANQRPWSTGLHIESSQTESALLATWSAAVTNLWADSVHGIELFYPTATNLDSVTVATLGPTMRELTKSTGIINLPGAAAGDTLPYQNATLVSLRSASVQRKGRGRMFMPAMEETFINDDVLTDAAATRVKAAFLALFSAITADGSRVFVFNRKDTSPLHPPVIPALTKAYITTPFVSNKPAAQRRRTRKVVAKYT
jgi:hypothetical protein